MGLYRQWTVFPSHVKCKVLPHPILLFDVGQLYDVGVTEIPLDISLAEKNKNITLN